MHNITYSIPGDSVTPGEVETPGTAIFSVSNTLTNTTHKIACGLRADSLCDLTLNTTGTTTGAGAGAGVAGAGAGVGVVGGTTQLDILFQALIGVTYVTVWETVSCGGSGNDNKVSVGGTTEVYFRCDFEQSPGRCWGEEARWVDAVVLGEVPRPRPPTYDDDGWFNDV